MKKCKLSTVILMLVILFVGMLNIPVHAETMSQDGLEIELTTDKSEYSSNEQVVSKLNLKNTNEFAIKNICVKSIIPHGYTLVNASEEMLEVETLEAGQEITITVAYVESAETLPMTDDESNILCIIIVCILSAVVFIFCVHKKASKKAVSVIMSVVCVVSVLLGISIETYASETIEKIIEIETKAKVNEKDVIIKNIISYCIQQESISDTKEFALSDTTDTDNDNLSDSVEKFLGTNSIVIDTDGDSLSDYDEIILSTDPTLVDTDGDKINDGQEDLDGDGINNLEELNGTTNPIDEDTDGDGLSDYEELYTVGTSPTVYDTDADGAKDGWEVVNKYDPLIYNDTFQVTKVAQGKNVSVSVMTETAGENISSFTAKEVIKNTFLDESIPGYVDSAFDFTINGKFEEAKISFTFDAALLSDETFKPVIYYFNEETQCLEELETQVEGNVASTIVTHFSTYILLNKTELDLVWDTEIKPPEYKSEYKGIDVVFVIDSSGSMVRNDEKNLRLQAAKEFIDKLGDNDRAAVVEFDSTATLYQGFTSAHDLLYNAINRVNRSGGTNLSRGISLAISQFTSSGYTRTDAYKYIIFLTDGDGTYSTVYTTQAKENGIIIYTIGLGSEVEESVLKNIATGTGGKYYLASGAGELGGIYEEVSVETVDYSTDSNEDGISDYYTKLLCEGRIKLGTGKDNPFKGLAYEDVQASNDYDGDGLLNGEELVVKKTELLNIVFAYLKANPVTQDTDYDGIDDNEENSLLDIHCNMFTADVSYSVDGNSYDTSVAFGVDYSWFFEDNTKFNGNLAVLASLYSLDMYDKGWLTLTYGATGSSKEENGVSLGEIFGLEDGKNYKASDLRDNYGETGKSGEILDADDVSEVYIGHRTVCYNGEEKEIFFLTIRGTNGTQAEWSSNFDIGADTDEYYDMTGEHPEWTNKKNHKGFDVTANRIMKAFDEYVSELEKQGKIDASIDRSIFITGHSRGAAVANVIGAKFELQTCYDTYVYTMASPLTTTNEFVEVYKTIFNIVNKDDLVTYLPMEEWGFKRYGETLEISVAEHYEDCSPFGDADNTFEAMFGVDYDDNDYTRDDAVESFEKIANNREDYYKLDTESGDGVAEEDKHKGYDNFLDILSAGKLDKYCKVEKKNNRFGYTIIVTYSPAYVGQIVANLASKGIRDSNGNKYELFTWVGLDLEGKYSYARTDFAIASGKIPYLGDAGLGGMECPHMPGTYYLITANTSYYSYER